MMDDVNIIPQASPIDTTPIGPVPLTLLQRIVRFPLVLIVIGFGMTVAAPSLVAFAARRLIPHPAPPLLLLFALIAAAAAILSYKAFKRWIEHAPDRELAQLGAAAELGRGVAMGFAIFATAVVFVWALGGIDIVGRRWPGDLWAMLALSVFSGVTEEIIFRGVVMRLLEKMVGTWWALAATSAFFGLAHLGNPNATWFAAFAIAVEAGVLLGACYLLTRRLWLAIGVHASWNFTQGYIFGIPVSGGKPPLGLLLTARHGPEWLTGGGFGLEASAVALVVATAAGVAMMALVVRRGGIMAPMWGRGVPAGSAVIAPMTMPITVRAPVAIMKDEV